MEDYLFESLDGYTVWGLQNGSDEETAAINAITVSGIPYDILVPHELHEGYVRLKLRRRSEIENFAIGRTTNGRIETTPLNDDQKEWLFEIFDKSMSKEHESEIKNLFANQLKFFDSISAVMNWWNDIPSAPQITVVGRVLASANARRLDPSLPELDN